MPTYTILAENRPDPTYFESSAVKGRVPLPTTKGASSGASDPYPTMCLLFIKEGMSVGHVLSSHSPIFSEQYPKVFPD